MYVAADAAPLGPQSRTSTTITVGNAGPNATTADTRVVYRTPFYVNIDHRYPLPDGCAMRQTDPDPAFPEVVECVIPAGLAVGVEKRLPIPIRAVAGQPQAMPIGSVLAKAGAPDVDPWNVDNVHGALVIGLLGPWARYWAPDTPSNAMAGAPALLTEVPPAVPSEYVDLLFTVDGKAGAPGDTVPLTLRVSNNGNLPTQSPVRLVVNPPLWTLLKPEALPAQCEVVVANPEPHIPETVECHLPPGLMPGATYTLDIPVEVLAGSPAGVIAGAGMAGVSAPDVEGFVTDNYTTFSMIRAADPPAFPPLGVDLWVSQDQLVLASGRPRTMTLRYGNTGSLPTRADSTLVFATPAYVNVDRTTALPPGCRIQADNPDSLIPEIVICRIPAGLRPGSDRRLEIPLRLEPGGPAGIGNGSVTFVSPDKELFMGDNAHLAVTIAVRP